MLESCNNSAELPPLDDTARFGVTPLAKLIDDSERIEAAYRARAAALACPSQALARDTAVVRAVVFRLGKECFGVPISKIERVIPDPVCTPLPGAEGRWAGVMAADGEILPVLQLGRILEVGNGGPPADPHVLKLRPVTPACGLLVGEVLEIRSFDSSDLRPAAGSIRGVDAVAPGNILLLDIEWLIAKENSQ